MTSPDRTGHRPGWAVSLPVGLALALSGCTLGQAGSFSGRADSSCRQVTRQIAALDRPSDAPQRLGFALDRYTDVERVVAEIASDISFPGGARGAALRRDWLEPARRSLRAGRDDLDALRAAVRSNDPAAQARTFRAAAAAGTAGVNLTTLRAQHLPSCATLFTADPTDTARS